MARHVIAIESVPDHRLPDTWLMPGSLRISDARIPVVFSFEYSETIGWASDLQRRDSEVSVEVELFPQWAEYEDQLFDWAFYANELVEEFRSATEDGPKQRFILEARVKAISMVPNAASPPFSRFSRKEQGS